MAKHTNVKKGAAKKSTPATKKKTPAVKTASKPKARPAPAKPASKPAAKAAAKPASKPAAKAAAKPAPKPKAATLPAPKAMPAVPIIDLSEALPIDERELLAAELLAAELLAAELPEPELVPVKSVRPSSIHSPKSPASPLALSVSTQSSAGSAANGNTHPANILVIVTCGGTPVTDLSKDHFTIMEHFEVPGQLAPFSNNITSFRNAGTGAYLLQTKPITGAPWRSGHHLAQILVSSSDDHQGQAAVKIVIR